MDYTSINGQIQLIYDWNNGKILYFRGDRDTSNDGGWWVVSSNSIIQDVQNNWSMLWYHDESAVTVTIITVKALL